MTRRTALSTRWAMMMTLPLAASAGTALAQVAVPVKPLDRFRVEANVRILYDDNIFRADGDTEKPVADLVYDPQVTATARQQFGHDLVTARGLLGYTQYQNHGSRNRSLAALEVDGRFGIGSRCQATPNAGYRSQELDYDDLVVRRTNTRQTLNYGVSISCPRPVGLYPGASASVRTVRNSDLFAYSDRDNRQVAAGIGYRRPSLGDLFFYIERFHSERPGGSLGVNATSTGARFSRAVSHRTQITADVHWLSVSSAAADNFKGLAWSVQGTLLPSPRFTVALNTSRSVNTSSLIASRYAIESSYGAEVNWQFSGRSAVRLSGSRAERRFRGLIDAAPIVARRSDRTTQFQAQYRYRLNTHLTLVAGGERFRRETDQPALGYIVNRLTLAAETNF